MDAFAREAREYPRAKQQQAMEARQRAAFFLVSGIDLDAALRAEGRERVAILARLGRLIERERLKGMRRHWSYDLNRHIALKQAYDSLKGSRASTERSSPSARMVGYKRKAAPVAPL